MRIPAVDEPARPAAGGAPGARSGGDRDRPDDRAGRGDRDRPGGPPPGGAAPADGPPRSDPGVRGAARGGLANLGGAGFAGLAGVVVTWLVARALGAAEAGAFFTGTAAFVLTGAVAKLGTQTGLVYWLSRLRATGRTDLLGTCLRVGLRPVTLGSLVLAVLLWSVAPALALATGGGADPQTIAQHATQLRVLAVFLPVATLADAMLTATRGYRQMRPTITLDRIVRPALQLIGIGALTVASLWASTPPWAFALAWVGPYLPVALLAGYALRRTYRAGDPGGAAPRAAEQARLRRRFWRFTGPRAVASVAQLSLQRIDVLLVAALSGLVPAAVYAVAGRFVVLGQFANQGVSQSVQPRLAEALATGDRAGANTLYQTATGWLVLATWPLYLMVITFSPVYLGLFGPTYRSGATVVVVLACAMLVATGCGMVDMVLSMAGRTTWNLANVLLALAVTVVLDLILIPRHGALGAAIGLAAAVLVNNLLPLVQVGRAFGLHPFGPGTVAAGGLAVACFGVLPQAVVALAGTGPAGLAGSLALAVPAYLFGARRLRRALALDSFIRRRDTSRRRDTRRKALTTNYTEVFQDAGAVEKYENVVYAPHSYASAINRRQRAYLRRLVSRSFRQRRPIQHDFACGTGRAIRTLHGLVRAAHGYDTSGAMLTKAAELGASAHLHQVAADGPVPAPARTERPAIVTMFRLLLNVDEAVRDRAMAFAAQALPDAQAGLLVVENHGNRRSLRHLGAGRHSGERWFAELSQGEVEELFERHGFELVERHGFSMLTPAWYEKRWLRPLARLLDELLLRLPGSAAVAVDVLYVARRVH